MTMMRFLVTTAMMATFTSAQTATTCPFTCQNSAPCVKGTDNTFDGHPTKSDGSPLDFLAETVRDDHYCDCPDNFTGIRCGRPFVECEGTAAGHYCYHGGTCLEPLSGDPISEEQLFCDCNKAEYDGIPYVGKHCELEGAQLCDPNDKEFFCLNAGTCKDDFKTKLRPCECPTGYRGPHCEFEQGSVPPCDLECSVDGDVDGECTLGIKDYDTALYTQFWATHQGFLHCTCPEGYFGSQCEVKGEKCGQSHCFNGAACLETIDVNSVTTYSCDCRTASIDQSEFAGDYCQSEATAFCSKTATNNGHLFCTNGGTCGDEAHTGCECLAGFHGPSCEFRDIEIQANCTLSCDNEGKCRKGAKDVTLISQFGSDLEGFNQTHTETWEHCVCPDGYFGVQCEHQLEICPGGDHVCLHGSKCMARHDGTELNQECDCDAGFDAIEKHAGKFCQYTSTDICTKHGKPGVGKANFAFCVNSGRCRAKVSDNEPHPGCDCPDGFRGDHCEFLKANDEILGLDGNDANKNPSVKSGKNSDAGLIIGFVVGGAIFAFLALIVVKQKKQGKEFSSDDGTDIASNTNISPRAETTGDPSFFDAQDEETVTDFPGMKEDRTMETVEII